MRAFFAAIDAGSHDHLLFCIGALLVGYALVEHVQRWRRR